MKWNGKFPETHFENFVQPLEVVPFSNAWSTLGSESEKMVCDTWDFWVDCRSQINK